MERIKWFGGVALAYFCLLIIALLVNNPNHNWIYWVATALVVVILMVFLIDHINQSNSITGWVLFGTVCVILTVIFVTYLSKYPTDTVPVVLFSTGVGKSVLIFSLFAAAAVLSLRVAFTAKTDPILFMLATPVFVSLFAISLMIFIIPFFALGGLSKLFPDNARVQALWDLLFLPIHKLQGETGSKERVLPNRSTTLDSRKPVGTSYANEWDNFEEKASPKKAIEKKQKDPGLFDKIKSTFNREPVEYTVRQEKQKIPPLFEKKVVRERRTTYRDTVADLDF